MSGAFIELACAH